MKLKKEFVLREIMGDRFLVPTGSTTLDLNGMLMLDEMGAEVWKLLPEVEDEESLVQKLFAEYDAPLEVIRADIAEFTGKLKALDIL